MERKLRDMRHKGITVRACGTWIAAIAFTLATAAQAATDPSAADLVARNLAARGGAERLASLQSVRFDGKLIFPGDLQLSYQETRARGEGADRVRIEATLQGLTIIQAYDGSVGWRVNPFEGRKDAERMSGDEARALADAGRVEGPLLSAHAEGSTLTAEGREDFDGTLAYKVKVTEKDGDEFVYLIDPDSWLEIKMTETRKLRGAQQITETELGDYEPVGGVMYPMSIESWPQNRPTQRQRTIIATATANPPVTPALFAMPVGPATAQGAGDAGQSDAARPPGEKEPPAEPKPATAAPAYAAPPAMSLDSSAISGLGIRNIGSAAMSGRVAAIAARQEADGKTTIYAGAASGGIWKSEDSGTTFRPVFDQQPVQSIGALALDRNNPQVVWAGTGEGWTRNSVSIGDGIYKSIDGGSTWTNMGLPNSERIVRIVVHPRDSNTVYACVPGALWSDSADRGLYKTTDGGKSWAQVLKGSNASTGCSTVALDPSNPERLLVGLWDFRRKAWTFRSGGEGPDAPSGSAMMESTDGGKSWAERSDATTKGLPKGPWGRSEIVFAPSNPKQVYAFIENIRSALYVSEDGGKSFEERDRSRNMVWRPFYFSRMVVDPKDDKKIFKMNLQMIVSEDGGKSFADAAGGSHGDWHDIWINPNNPKEIVGGDDGGIWFSHDGGSKWWKGYNLPVSQFYHVSADERDPYQVYGGLQDNSSWVADSAYPGGVTNSRWENLYNGDGMWSFSDPADANFVYTEAQGGTIGRVDRRTLEQRDIQPKGGYKEKLRFNWNTPIALSPNEKGTIYIGSQFLFRSRDHGQSWDRISPDLTTNDPSKQKQEESGGITVDNSAAEMHTTIYSISESPKAAGQIWVGTDDGNVQLTRDGGKSWTDLTANLKLPNGEWINWVEASRFDPAVAYVVVDRHAFGDFAPYLLRTGDYGRSWQPLMGQRTPGVRGYAFVVKEDRVDPNILYVGTEFGLYASTDRGAHWAQFKPNNFPDVAVRDIYIVGRDDALVLATHGRGIWIIDDISSVRALNAATLGANVALIPGRTMQQRIRGSGGWPEGDATYSGDNPADGAVISYYQKTRHVIGRMKLEILDQQGKVVDEIPASKRKGLNRVIWSMRTRPPQVPPAASLAYASTQGQRFMPGTYTVRLTKAGQITTMPLVIGLDRRATFTIADRQAQFDAAERVKGLFARMTALVAGLNGLRAASEQIADRPGVAAPLKERAEALSAQADTLRKLVVATKEGGAITGEERLRENMDSVYGAVTSTEAAPTPYALARIDALERELKEVEDSYAALKADEASKLSAALISSGGAPLELAAVAVEDDESRGGPASALARGLVGTRFSGSLSTIRMAGERN